ncbi:hypothetical protein ACFSTI_15965 [Rhizorhabdus histidinilytica]
MGSPVAAVRWLVAEVRKAGRLVEPGHIISSGCPCPQMVTVPATGGCWESVVDGFGRARVIFSKASAVPARHLTCHRKWQAPRRLVATRGLPIRKGPAQKRVRRVTPP